MKITQEQTVAALLSAGSVRSAAKLLNVAPSTVQRAMDEPGFAELYAASKKEILQSACNKLSGNICEAADIIAAIMKDSSNAPQIRINAAQLIFNTYTKLTEQNEILERSERLESQVQP